MAFRDMLKKHMERRGWSDAQLARQAEVSVDSLRRWIYQGGLPGLRNAKKLARALGVSLDQLAAEVEDEPKKKA